MRVSALLRFEKRSNSIPLRHAIPSWRQNFCLPLPHSFVATGEGSAPLLFRAAYGATSDLNSSGAHLWADLNCHSLAIPGDSGNSKYYLVVNIYPTPYPLPIHPRSPHFGVDFIPKASEKASQANRF